MSIQNIIASVCPFVVRKLGEDEEKLFREHYPNRFARYIAKLVVVPMVDKAMKQIKQGE